MSLKFGSVQRMDAFEAPPDNSVLSLAERTSFHSSAPDNFCIQLMATAPLTVLSAQIKVVGSSSLATNTSSEGERIKKHYNRLIILATAIKHFLLKCWHQSFPPCASKGLLQLFLLDRKRDLFQSKCWLTKSTFLFLCKNDFWTFAEDNTRLQHSVSVRSNGHLPQLQYF